MEAVHTIEPCPPLPLRPRELNPTFRDPAAGLVREQGGGRREVLASVPFPPPEPAQLGDQPIGQEHVGRPTALRDLATDPHSPAPGVGREPRLLSTYSYLGERVWKRWSGNGIETRFYEAGTPAQPLYDSLGRVRGIRSIGPGGSPTVADFRYGYDRVGNRTYEQRRHEPLTAPSTFRTRATTSDLLGRLTKWREGSLGADTPTVPAIDPAVTDPTSALSAISDGERWTLDSVGNWIDAKRGSATEITDTFARNVLNQYASIDPATSGQPKAFTFDWLGQLIRDDSKNRKYQWDAFGRLTRVITPGQTPAQDTVIATYRYDAFNRRVEKTTSAASDLTTRYFYDGWRAIEERAVLVNSSVKSEVVRARYGFGVGLDEVLWMDRDLNLTDDLGVDN